MRLIGMLDSPYVRRTAIGLDCLGVAFEHEAISVFSTFEQFHSINPVVKAPTLICDDGEILMDSSLILQFAEAMQSDGRSLWPAEPAALQHDMRAVGLALAASEKSVQIVYERNLRPPAARHAPWLSRIEGQLAAAYSLLEQEVARRPGALARLCNAGIAAAVAWRFTQSELAELVPAQAHPQLAALSDVLEATPPFLAYPPVGPGVQRSA